MAQENTADIGLIGLAVMGQNLVLNMHDKGFTVAVFNRTVSKVDAFLQGPAKGTSIIGAHSLPLFIKTLKRPRKIMMMVRAGSAVDQLIEECLPHLEKGDILIDGGNSHYPDSERRCKALAEKGILFVGTGVSGGEEGARHGPSLMPGGAVEAWPHIKKIFQSIAAKSSDQEPCCEWVGDGGSGHFVKMVHNGIEYGDMQIICEAYQVFTQLLNCSTDELANIFAKYNKGKLDSYLIEITSAIFGYKENGEALVDKILDTAGQKGTGKWTAITALDFGMPLTLIGEAVFARCLSALKEQRVHLSQILGEIPLPQWKGKKEAIIAHMENALYAAKIISYTQGFMLLASAAQELKWKLNYGSIALMWRGGCIIRSQFLGKIKEAYDKQAQLDHLLLDDFFKKEITQSITGLREIVVQAQSVGISVPCLSAALNFFDGFRSKRLPANLLQAQRDFFGAHTYERTDKPRGQFFHTNWTGSGGDVSSSTYNV